MTMIEDRKPETARKAKVAELVAPAVIEQAPGTVPAVSEATALIHMIERAARDPAVDIDKMERLMAMRDRIVAHEAQVAFDAAFSQMQPNLPVIEKKGRIEGESKRTGDRISQAFGRWEDIAPAIIPITSAFGFGIRFEQEQVQDIAGTAKTRIICVLSHAAGHRERAHFDLPLDTSGSKNNVQAYGSTASYGKRYSAMLALNIVTKGEDDDGKAAGAEANANAAITEEQVVNLRDMIEATNSDQSKFLKFFRIDALADLPAARHDEALAMLKAKVKK